MRGLVLCLAAALTLLTNPERRELRGSDRLFVCEELGFRPQRYDVLGFGPTGISFAHAGEAAVKVVNADRAAEYVTAVDRSGSARDRGFVYAPRDLRIFHPTRRVSALRIDRPGYRAFFGSDPIDDFPGEFELPRRGGLRGRSGQPGRSRSERLRVHVSFRLLHGPGDGRARRSSRS
jgi:oxygen-independent coproporphyrinogen-3 oxidase